ncbi:MAG: TIGR01459 family HAD-type hydrolase [Alphaproteobacteria bacterium]|nr:MAG: TIGR01459 family HAD-type hydrolase [Alphaproteobacteria bacterium]TMJ71800.1 MAG: TIGR01459 family HAD-type hydrolase [Alphaproteobacteria bacterium]
MPVVLPPFTPHFATLARGYDVALCDVWGVVHNGAAATSEACDALGRFRKQGGTVVLITNAPRPGEIVARTTLDRLGVPRAAYDGIVSSGDVTRALIAARAGAPVFHIGPERDLGLFDGLDAPLAPLEDADYTVCSGLIDDTVETPQDYQDLIARMRARSLAMICANPDVVVERGDQLVYCAGAIADLYAAAGGDVVFAGKPYRPIYEQALALAEATRGKRAEHHRVLAIGDSVRTDVKGAAAFGIDCLFVIAGIHAEELGGRTDPDAAALAGIFAAAGVIPKAVMRHLSW